MSKSPEEIQADIETQREQLAETVDALTHKLDVKAQGKAKAEELKQRPELLAGAAGVVLALGLLIWWRRRS